MTAPNTGGALRSQPRYSSTADGGIKSKSAARSDDSCSVASPTPTRINDGIGGNNNNLSATKTIMGGTTTPSNKATGGIKTCSTKTRSLADLVKSSVDLSAEASGFMDSERGNVISHSHQHNTSTSNSHKKEVKFTEGESMSTLHISEKGTLFLKEPDIGAKSGGPEVVDTDTPIAFGVMGEDGQQVRFCEYDDDENIESNSSSRDRLEKTIDAGHDDEFDDDDEEGKDNHDSDSDSGDAQDDDIFRELGLSELIPEAQENEEEGEMIWGESELDNADSGEFRSFRVLWELLSRWVTPLTIEFVLKYQGKCKQPLDSESSQSSENFTQDKKPSADSRTRSTVDIGASRRASIMSMLTMSIPRSLSELKKMQKQKGNAQNGVGKVDQRQVKDRLGDLLRTFDSSAPAANLNMKMWKGLTTILIAIVFPISIDNTDLPDDDDDDDDDNMLPPSVRPLKLSAAEYRYLTQSAIVSLSSTA